MPDPLLIAMTFTALAGWTLAFIQTHLLAQARKQLDKASNNDARDPKTGRYVGRKGA